MKRKITRDKIRVIAHKSGLPVELIKWRVMMGYPVHRIGERTYDEN